MRTYLSKITNDFKKTTKDIYTVNGNEIELDERNAVEAVVNADKEYDDYFLLYGASAINNAYKLRNSVILPDGRFSPKMREYKDDNAEKEILELLAKGVLKTEIAFENIQNIEGYSQRKYHEVENTCYQITEGKYKGVYFAKAHNTKEDRDCICIDISNTDLTVMSKKWQLSNLSAFEFATKLIEMYPNKDIDWYAGAVHFYWLNENQYAIEYKEPTAKPYCMLDYVEKIKDRDNIYVAETFEQNKDKANNIENCRDIVRLASKHVAKKIYIGNKNVNVFLSVAWPEKENTAENKLIADIGSYFKAQGITLVNVKNITGKNIELLSEIQNTMTNCCGVLSLAFGKHNTNKTSPYVCMEGVTAANLNLDNLVLIPKEVEVDEMLQNIALTKIEKNSDKMYDIENNLELKLKLDSFIDSVKLKAFGTLEYKDYVDENLCKVDNLTFANRLIKKYELNPDILNAKNIVFKRPVKVEVTKITKSGYYETCNGNVFLNIDDVLVKSADGNLHEVASTEFEKIYIKDATSNLYIKKPIPMVMLNKNEENITVAPMYNPKDIYQVPTDYFKDTYETLASHLNNQPIQNKDSYNVIRPEDFKE